jgi:lambda repressor-like predicted transcriptional regulator
MTQATTQRGENRLSIEPVMAMFAEKDLCVNDIGEVCGFSRKTYYRLLQNGVPLTWAEKIAHSLGLHPTEIWGSAYTMLCAAEDEFCAQESPSAN